MKNAIFIHCGNLPIDKYGQPNTGRCQSIVNEISSYLTESNIIAEVEFINLEVVGSPDIEFQVDKGTVNFNGTDATQWEFPTLEKIIEFAKHNNDYNILYLHTKGSSTTSDGFAKYADDVRNYHLYWTVTKYVDCLEALKVHDVVGAELQYVPARHFSHNMWWARASHINKLKHPLDYPTVLDIRHQAEFWIGQDESSSYHSVNTLYDTHAIATSYEKHLYIRP